MNKPMSEQKTLLMMLTEIYDQLEELDCVLEASFSDLRSSLNNVELNKLNIPKQKLSNIEKECMKQNSQTVKHLKLEMGF